jgi:hypothetical protein
MRILVADYSGHPFQVQLSRELARRGHSVTHTYSTGFQTPKGNLRVGDDDPAGFAIIPVANSRPFAKNSFFTRRQQEIEIGRKLAELTRTLSPDIVISSNAPLDTQRVFMRAANQRGAKFAFWLQDIYSEAISRVVPRKFPLLGHLVAAQYRALEFRMLRESDHVVAITEDFRPILIAKGVNPAKISVVENWAPLDELPRHPRDNDWARANMPGDGVRIVYSGTLGYKHNPGLLLALARELADAQVHVFSEGQVAAALAADGKEQGLGNLTVHPWVPFADLPQMLSGADIFVAVIEPEAGVRIIYHRVKGDQYQDTESEHDLTARPRFTPCAQRQCHDGDHRSHDHRVAEHSCFDADLEKIVVSSVRYTIVQIFEPFSRKHRRLESPHSEAYRPILLQREPAVLPHLVAAISKIGEALRQAR